MLSGTKRKRSSNIHNLLVLAEQASKRQKIEISSTETKSETKSDYQIEDHEEFVIVYLQPKDELLKKNPQGILFYDIDGVLISIKDYESKKVTLLRPEEVRANNKLAEQKSIMVGALTGRGYSDLQVDKDLETSALAIIKAMDNKHFAFLIFAKDQKNVPMQFCQQLFSSKSNPIPENRLALVEDQQYYSAGCHEDGFVFIPKLFAFEPTEKMKDKLIIHGSAKSESKDAPVALRLLNDTVAVKKFIEGNLLKDQDYLAFMSEYTAAENGVIFVKIQPPQPAPEHSSSSMRP